MFRKQLIGLAICALLSTASPAGEPLPPGDLYQIVSGTFEPCCGFQGDFASALPNDSQAFVRLTVDPLRNVASMAFLGADMETVFSVAPCPADGPINFSFDSGLIFPDRLVFHVDPGPAPYREYWNYTASNLAAGLRIDGLVGIDPVGCVDAMDRFMHSNVVAVLMPTAAIRVSEVEICWMGATNRNYQLQYRSQLTTNAWTNLGLPVAGNGSTNSLTDKVPLGQPQRFYRVLPVP